MQFKDFKYQRINIPKIKEQVAPMIESFLSSSLGEQITIMKNMNQIMDQISSMFTLVNIRNSLNVKDNFYQQEQAFCDHNAPLIKELQHQFLEKISQSKYYDQLASYFGLFLFQKNHLELKTFHPQIIPLLQEENALVTEYENLISQPNVNFQNKMYNLSQMGPFLEAQQRETRKEAQLAVSHFFAKNESDYDHIYDQLVNIRHKMANLLGYDNFVQLGYDLLGRTDYSQQQVKTYRENILKHVLPFYQMTQQKKSNRLKINKLESYDKKIHFLSGNPTPEGDTKTKISNAQQMYHQMSPATKVFFDFLLDKQLLDLESKPNKTGGGYCTYLPLFQAPFIFANFNGTSHDIDVLTHEFGHAFQVYQSRHFIPEYRFPTLEAAEISSMGMEFLAWPWMKNFFGSEEAKYKFLHLSEGLNFLLYGALVDYFQEEIYQNPHITPQERKKIWRDLEKKYLLINEYESDLFLEKGNFWLRQSHIFSSPFYYIDYTLAQVCAFELWSLSQKDYQQAWETYLKLCQIGGSQSFLKLLEKTGLKSPFDEKHFKTIVDSITNYIQKIDDSKF
ncbi:M3 family oligoendopeptidase [Candidatus Phytoplasma australiense]|uniref:Oligoendopeptidase F-like protein n=1 Tax=Strawberry lethal yellows phytoplasma (CPA) str. NZSb11 TaxID=980422 RepID=R4S1H5_PHYAS|nr:M3 family oligoendopeptidase [Candidatus Phytoplasma australiense]AGL90654.1 Oligoendopeptidase F-like protein [Strawberry lethal yellows phytoplasma (CPA) str. NZSb11]